MSVLLSALSCGSRTESVREDRPCDCALYFEIPESEGVSVISISPYDGSRDTLYVDAPMDNIICMSSTYVAALTELGADSVVTAVSGLRYITNPSIRSRAAGSGRPVYDIGYEASLDYERIVKLKPDVLITYSVSGAEPQYVAKVRSLGVPVLVLNDHLEEHPLARAEYLRLFGALTGKLREADSLFAAIRERYDSLRADAVQDRAVKVLMNVPYADAWYIPGGDSYMSRLINDAGGCVLGAQEGESASRVISMEQAYMLSSQADMWLDPGHCRTLRELSSVHQLFVKFGPISKGLPVYNNTLRTTPEGGNDFWESGAIRPDLVLNDLIRIFNSQADSLYYHFRLD